MKKNYTVFVIARYFLFRSGSSRSIDKFRLDFFLLLRDRVASRRHIYERYHLTRVLVNAEHLFSPLFAMSRGNDLICLLIRRPNNRKKKCRNAIVRRKSSVSFRRPCADAIFFNVLPRAPNSSDVLNYLRSFVHHGRIASPMRNRFPRFVSLYRRRRNEPTLTRRHFADTVTVCRAPSVRLCSFERSWNVPRNSAVRDRLENRAGNARKTTFTHPLTINHFVHFWWRISKS